MLGELTLGRKLKDFSKYVHYIAQDVKCVCVASVY